MRATVIYFFSTALVIFGCPSWASAEGTMTPAVEDSLREPDKTEVQGSVVVSPISAMEAASPIGYWKTIDDKTQKPKAIVQIREEEGMLKGKIVKLFPREGRPDNPVCDKCKGDRKDKPIVGLEFLWGLKKDSATEWKGGEILDPENGSVYSSKAELIEQGKKFKVRGFLGFALLGRTQVWERDLEFKPSE